MNDIGTVRAWRDQVGEAIYLMFYRQEREADEYSTSAAACYFGVCEKTILRWTRTLKEAGKWEENVQRTYLSDINVHGHESTEENVLLLIGEDKNVGQICPLDMEVRTFSSLSREGVPASSGIPNGIDISKSLVCTTDSTVRAEGENTEFALDNGTIGAQTNKEIPHPNGAETDLKTSPAAEFDGKKTATQYAQQVIKLLGLPSKIEEVHDLAMVISVRRSRLVTLGIDPVISASNMMLYRKQADHSYGPVTVQAYTRWLDKDCDNKAKERAAEEAAKPKVKVPVVANKPSMVDPNALTPEQKFAMMWPEDIENGYAGWTVKGRNEWLSKIKRENRSATDRDVEIHFPQPWKYSSIHGKKRQPVQVEG